MVVTNIETVPGKNIVEHYGIVQGSTIRAKHVGRDLMAGLKNIVGGELKGYTDLLQESRRQAMERMLVPSPRTGAFPLRIIEKNVACLAGWLGP